MATPVLNRVAIDIITMVNDLVEQIKGIAMTAPQQFDKPIDWSKTVSTGSTLLDKAISGLKCRYGGLPGGILVEISGPPGSGKTTIMAEVVGSVQRIGGEVRIKDPEARLDPDYCLQMGVKFDQEYYFRPDTVTDVIESIIGPLVIKGGKTKRDHDQAWCPNPDFINCEGVDSLAALSTRMELDQGDKMGQRRAKELSEGLRIIARHIKNYNILMICTNQLRENVDAGPFAPKMITPGGHAIPFYASIRIQLRIVGKIMRGNHIIGKNIEAFINKNSCDIEWRTAPIRLVFGYGVDDIGANLEWLKSVGAMSEHPTEPSKKALGYVVGNKYFPQNMPSGALDSAIKYVEDNNLEQDIKDWVVDVWDELEKNVRVLRKEKIRR